MIEHWALRPTVQSCTIAGTVSFEAIVDCRLAVVDYRLAAIDCC